jgi:HB1, ASXL, restriction endonuclease HTH domain
MVITDEHLDNTEGLQQLLPDVLDDDALREAAEAAAQKAQIAEARAEQWAQVAVKARREEVAYLQILRLRNDEPDSPPHSQSIPEVSASSNGDQPVVRASIQVLEREGRPLHISELMRILQESNVEIPGSGEQANLISYLRRDTNIVRPSRGVYGLRAWGLEDMAPTKRAPKRRRKTSKKKVRGGR